MPPAAGSYIEGESATRIAQMALADFEGAKRTRQTIEERKLEAYQLYHRYRKEIQGGGKRADDRGPFGWSKLTIPIAFWTTETIVPRIITRPPRPVVAPRNLAAAPYVTAKGLRLERQFERAAPIEPLIISVRQMSIYGDGPVKVTWDADERRPKITAVDWWSFWISPEASNPDTAECLFHMTWHTKRQLQALARLKDEDGAPLFANLDQIWDDPGSRDVEDPLFAERREAAGLGPVDADKRRDVIPLLEAWYDDGSRVILGGAGFHTLVHARLSPFRDERGRPIRPFVVFQNTPDLHMPYSIGDLEVVRDYQHELSTIRNQATDQVTANINAPIVHDENIPAERINAALASPGGRIPAPGDVTRAVQRLNPGYVPQDVAQLTEMVFAEVQRATGLNDYAAGQPSPIGLFNNTATAAQIAVGEANKRWQARQAWMTLGFEKVIKLVDHHDRRFMLLEVPVPLAGRETPAGERAGMTVTEDGSLAIVTAEVNGWVIDENGQVQALPEGERPEYDISVEEGSASPPSQRERAQNVVAFLAAVAPLPQLASLIDWQQVGREVITAFGFSPEKLLISGGAAAAAQQAGPGEVPVGQPVPLTPDEEQAVAQSGGAPAGAGPDSQPEQVGSAESGLVPVGPPIPMNGSMGAEQPVPAAPAMPSVQLNLEPGAVVVNAAGGPQEPPPITVEVPRPDVRMEVPLVVNVGSGAKRVIRDANGDPRQVEEEIAVETDGGESQVQTRRYDVVYDDEGRVLGMVPADEEQDDQEEF
jgi:hypothetical protein